MSKPESFLGTPPDETVYSVYPLEFPPDLQSVVPLGALLPSAPIEGASLGEVLRSLTYRSSGGFNYPRERVDADFDNRVAANVSKTRAFLNNPELVKALINSVSAEAVLIKESLLREKQTALKRSGLLERIRSRFH